MARMRTAAIVSFGGPEVLRPMDLPSPSAGPDEVVIRVVAAGVNPVDAQIRCGALAGRREHRFPLVLGREAAGVVEEVGSGVARLRVGDRVWTYHRPRVEQRGTYAECVAVAESEVSRMPSGLLYEEAAAVPCSGLTAWQALHEHGGVLSGSTVVVLGAAGGVGHLAVQLAAEAGARIVAVAAARDHAFVASLGAQHTVDPAADDPGAAIRRLCPQGADLIVDTTGDRRFDGAIAWLAPGGRLVGPAGRTPSTDALGRSVVAFGPRAELSHLDALAERIARGRVRVHVERMWPLADAAAGHRRLEAGGVRGKLVLTL